MSPQRQLGLLWGGVALALVALSRLPARWLPVLPPCPVKTLTGLPCPTCGATRTAWALAHLDLLGALAVSPLATLGWVALVGGGLVAGLAALLGFGVPEPPQQIAWPWRALAVLLVAANWVYLVWHGT